MFTVKVYRTRFIGDPGKSVHKDKVAVYQCRSIEIEDEGITLFGMGNPEDTAWVPYPYVDRAEPDESDWCVSMVVIENAAGKTTEVIRG